LKEIKTENVENLIKPIEETRTSTALNIRQSHRDGISKYAFAQKMTLTDVVDEFFSIALSKVNDTAIIDQMMEQTNGFIFSRDVERVKAALPSTVAKKLTPYQVAYLYTETKDQSDAQRVFDALQLKGEIDEISECNRMLEIASKFSKDGQLLGYNLATLANVLKSKLSQLQSEYLTLKLGQEPCKTLQARRPDLFPKPNIFTDETENDEEIK
jgi:hypothetical protein